MGGGLMQLVAYGAQDVYLTGSPQITFFKLVYRRHTNFAVESIEQVFNGTPGFGKKASATISRNGDLITQVFLQITVPHITSSTPAEKFQLVNSFAHALIESCEIEIGGQRIDKHYSAYYEVCDELMCPEEKRIGYGKMVGKMYDATGKPNDQSKASGDQLDTHMARLGSSTYYMPLRFWFNNNPGLALPLISLQYHEVKLQFSFSDVDKLILKLDDTDADPSLHTFKPISMSGGSALNINPEISLYVDYIYLDTEERRRFAQVSHEYLIEQLQFTGVETYTLPKTSAKSEKIRLNFNHPCKELIFFVRPTDGAMFEFGETVEKGGITGYDYVEEASLLLNGHDRFSTRKGSYFRLVVPFQVHTRVPSRHVYCYSFALRPEEHQPSGSCNFSRIDNASLHLTFAPSSKGAAGEEQVSFTVYALSYNILRIMSGMGGLAYSN
jgi:hypothetical protein